MRRLRFVSIHQNKTRVAKLLSYGATRAKTAEFKKEIETQRELRGKSKELREEAL